MTCGSAFVVVALAIAAAATDAQRLEDLALHAAPREADALAVDLAGRVVDADAAALEALLAHKDRRARQYAAVALRRVRPVRAVAELSAQALLPEDGIQFWARQAVRQLGVVPGPAAASALADLVVVPPPSVAKWAPEVAADALRAGSGAALVKARLVEACGAPSPVTAMFAALTLWDVDRATSMRTLQGLWSRRATLEPPVANALAHRLTQLCAPELAATVREVLRGRDPFVKQPAAACVARTKDLAAVDDLVAVVANEREGIPRAAALLALSSLGDAAGIAKAEAALRAAPPSPREATLLREGLDLARVDAPPDAKAHWSELLQPRTPDAAAAEKVAAANDACTHWGGEEPYDADRAQEIQNGGKRDCAAAVKTARDAVHAHPGSPLVRKGAAETLRVVEGLDVSTDELRAALDGVR